jgi:hypothetical protein
MAQSSQPISTFDTTFFRNTGLALVGGTLVAGAVMLSLVVSQSQSVLLAQEAQPKASLQLVAASVAESVQAASQE